MIGRGIWLRPGAMPRIEACAEHLDYVVYPLARGSSPLHVGPAHRAWLSEWLGRGKIWWAMDWLPKADKGAGHVDEVCERGRALGAAGLMADCEPDADWRGAVRQAVAYRAALADHRGSLDLAITDYARGGIGDAALGALLAEVGGHRPIGVPQSYDPDGRYDPGYHERSVSYWRSLGAQRVVVGLGAWLRGRKRHRTPDELRRHLAGVPEDVQGVCAWYADRDALDDGDADRADDLLPVLGAWGRDVPAVPEVVPWRTRAIASLEELAGAAMAEGDRGAAAELLRCAARLRW